jgi:histidine triad (HIT) family protein
MAYDANNIFARMVRGEIPCIRVHEDAETLAFMDIMPQAEGHTLVVPKIAGEGIFDTPPESMAAAIRTTQRVARAVQKAFAPRGLIITQFNGPTAGQTVFHLHFHVVPVYAAGGARPHARDKADPAVLEAHAVRIRAALAAG